MDFAALPPEINSGRMYAGPGPGSLLAAASAWDGLAAELGSTAASYQSVITELTGGAWTGPSAASMAAAATPYVQWLTTTAAHAEQSATQAKAAAAAYESAFAMTVPPPVIATNRSLLAALIATNVVGQNTMAIAATEADYAEMWAQDATAMYGYAGSSAAASTLTPFPSPPATTNPTGQAASAAQSITANGPQVMSALTQALQGMSSAPAAADPSTALLTALTAIIIPLTAVDIPIATTSATASTTSATASFTSTGTTFRGLLINADRDFGAGKGPYTGYGPGAAMLPEWILAGPNAFPETASAPTPPVAAGLGQATNVGRLSVPTTWAVAAPEYRPAAYTMPLTSTAAVPEIVAGTSDNWLTDLAWAGAAGRAVSGTAPQRQRDQRVRFIHHNNGTPPPAQGESVTEMAAQVREIAALAQSLLTKLVDSGVMTADEVTEQKNRFRW
jgi:PPE-repeat protein